MMYRDNASTISQPYQFTYKSSGGDWSPYYVLSPVESNPNILQENTSVRCVLPMEVQTKYILGNIEYTATGFSGTYDSLEHNISVNVTNLTNYNYKISYSLTGKDNTWQTTNFKFKDVVNQTVYFKIEADYYKTITGSKVVNIDKKEDKDIENKEVIEEEIIDISLDEVDEKILTIDDFLKELDDL